MKNRLLRAMTIIGCGAILCVSCGPTFPKVRYAPRTSYILTYASVPEKPNAVFQNDGDGRFTIVYEDVYNKNGLGIYKFGLVSSPYYYFDDCFDHPDNFKIFNQIAAKFGDTGYGKMGEHVSNLGMVSRVSLAYIITDINITSTADWDDMHPAGTLFDDVFDITYATFAEYVDSDYDETKLQTVKETRTKTVADISDTDLRLIVCSIGSYKPTPYYTVKSLPTAEKRHTLTIKLFLDDGTTRESTVEAEFP